MKKLSEIDLTFNNNGKKQNYFIQFYVLKTRLKDVTIQEGEVENVKIIPQEEAFEMIRQGKISLGYNKENQNEFEKLFLMVREYSQKGLGRFCKNSNQPQLGTAL